MKITAIRTLVVNAEMRNWVFVKVETDQPGLLFTGKGVAGEKRTANSMGLYHPAVTSTGEDVLQYTGAVSNISISGGGYNANTGTLVSAGPFDDTPVTISGTFTTARARMNSGVPEAGNGCGVSIHIGGEGASRSTIRSPMRSSICIEFLIQPSIAGLTSSSPRIGMGRCMEAGVDVPWIYNEQVVQVRMVRDLR